MSIPASESTAGSLISLSLGAVLAAIELPAAPHGGSYRGPGNVTPPNSGNASAPPCSMDNPPSTPGPSQPGGSPKGGAPLPSGGGSGRGLGRVPRGIMVGEDLSKWQYWWEFNKDAYLQLKQALNAPRLVAGSAEVFMGAAPRIDGHLSARPSARDVREWVLPGLHEALAKTSNRDITSSCLIAMAKIGRADRGFDFLAICRDHLTSSDQEIRETAALAMGISQLPGAVSALLSLATDGQTGRRLCNRSRVDGRTRAFAAYGLGLVAHAHHGADLHKRVFAGLQAILDDATIVDRNILVAAINAMALIDRGEAKLVGTIVQTLIGFYDAETSAGRAVIRAHVPPAVARLLGTGATVSLKTRFARDLSPRRQKANLIARSAAIALGSMVRAAEIKKADAPFSQALRRYFESGRDGQARYFSLVSLAQIGGAENRSFLLRVLATGNRGLERPWAAIALGLLAHRARIETRRIDTAVARRIHAAFRESRTPYARGAMAISLGLTGYRVAAPDLLKHLASHGHQDEMSGYLCVGLALMRHTAAKEQIAKLLDTSIRRPHRLRMAAIALGKLGDRRLTRRLMDMLTEGEPNLAKMAAVANALAQIGDRHSIQPLRKMLLDDKLPELTRAFAAVALGGIADKEPLPWNAKIAVNMNYRAAVETLVESGAGVLEIL